MNTLERVKILKKLKDLSESKKTLTGLAKAKNLKEILELRTSLGFSIDKPITTTSEPEKTVFQAVIAGEKTLSIETLTEMLAEGEKDQENPDLVTATQILVDQFNEKVA